MKTWQKWTLGCLAGVAIPFALAGCVLMFYAVFLSEPTPVAAEPVAAMLAQVTSPPAATEVKATEAPTYSQEVIDGAWATWEVIQQTSVAPASVDPALATAAAQATMEANRPTATKGPMPTDEPTEDMSGTISPGTWLVGSEIEPGTYRGNCTFSCYWERLSCLTGEFDCIITNDWVTTDGPFMVTIQSGDYAFTTDEWLYAVK